MHIDGGSTSPFEDMFCGGERAWGISHGLSEGAVELRLGADVEVERMEEED